MADKVVALGVGEKSVGDAPPLPPTRRAKPKAASNRKLAAQQKGSTAEDASVEEEQQKATPLGVKSRAKKSRSDGEQRVSTLLLGLGVLCDEERWWPQCRDKAPLRFDFFVLVEGKGALIEVDGRQHSEVVPDLCVGVEELAIIREHDRCKNLFARANKLSLLRVAHTDMRLLEKWVIEFLEGVKLSKDPVYRFSSPALYPDPFGDEDKRVEAKASAEATKAARDPAPPRMCVVS
jgi:hypothetical protein